jgi:hypothetical protein
MPITLSETALSLLRLHLAGKALILKGPNAEALPGCSMEETLAAYRELAAVGLMYPVSGFAHGPESLYRLSDEGWERRHEFLN